MSLVESYIRNCTPMFENYSLKRNDIYFTQAELKYNKDIVSNVHVS